MTTDFQTLADEIRQRFSEVRTSLEVLQELTESDYPLNIRIEAGSALWSINEEALNLVAPFKDELREIAVEALGGDGTWQQEGHSHGYAKVVIPKDTIRLRKGTDTATLQQSPSFDQCFEVVTTIKPRKDVGTTIMKLASVDRGTVMDAIESVSSTPRVSLKRR